MSSESGRQEHGIDIDFHPVLKKDFIGDQLDLKEGDPTGSFVFNTYRLGKEKFPEDVMSALEQFQTTERENCEVLEKEFQETLPNTIERSVRRHLLQPFRSPVATATTMVGEIRTAVESHAELAAKKIEIETQVQDDSEIEQERKAAVIVERVQRETDKIKATNNLNNSGLIITATDPETDKIVGMASNISDIQRKSRISVIELTKDILERNDSGDFSTEAYDGKLFDRLALLALSFDGNGTFHGSMTARMAMLYQNNGFDVRLYANKPVWGKTKTGEDIILLHKDDETEELPPGALLDRIKAAPNNEILANVTWDEQKMENAFAKLSASPYSLPPQQDVI